MPSEILEEEDRLPVGFMDLMIEYRYYASAKFANDHDPNPTGFEGSEMRRLAMTIEMELAHEDVGLEME